MNLPAANKISLRCIQVIAGVLGRAGEAGQKQRLAAAAEGRITYRPAQGLTLAGTEADGNMTSTSTSRMGEAVPEQDVAEAVQGGLDNTDKMAADMDEVNNHESHRTRGGRDIKITS